MALALAACGSADQDISAGIARQFDAGLSAPVNLALVGPSNWTRVCVLGPYSTDATAEQVLGFKWPVDKHSSIGRNDGINLLVFVRDRSVVAFAEHPRSKGDFLELSPRCLDRGAATLMRKPDAAGWSQLVTVAGGPGEAVSKPPQ